MARKKSPAIRPHVRRARAGDVQAITEIYNEGIEERQATFETRWRTREEIAERIATERHPLLVAELGGGVVGWAALVAYSSREVYSGIAEASIYVTRSARGRGIGMRLAEETVTYAEEAGLYKLIGKLFPENAQSFALVRRLGFREVGIHRCHGRLDGAWRDVVVVEQLLDEAARACQEGEGA